MAGWIKLHRKIRQNPIFNDPKLLRLWMICLTEATHSERDQIIGNQVVKLLPGEFVTGRYDIQELYNQGLPPSEKQRGEKTVYRWLETMQKSEMLTIKKTNKYSIVSINNWSMYQGDDQQMTNKRPSDDQQMTTNKNVKNEENGKKKDLSRKRVYDADSLEYKIALFFYQQILKNNSKHKEPNLQNWANDIRLLLEIDNRDKTEVGRVIQWAQKDSFWMTNILSPKKLREKYDALVIKMKQEQSNGSKDKPAPKSSEVQEFELDITRGE